MSKQPEKPQDPPRLEMKAEDRSATILLYGDIGEWYGDISAAGFAKQLAGLGPLDVIHLHIKSNGGAVFDGVAIYSTLVAHEARVVVHIEGIAASIAAFIVQAGDERIINDVSQFMVHPASGFFGGTADELEQYLRLLRNTDEIIRNLFAKRSGQDAEVIAELFAKDSYLTPQEALELGFVDTVTESVTTSDKATTAHAPVILNAPTVDFDTARKTLDRLAALASPNGGNAVTKTPENQPTATTPEAPKPAAPQNVAPATDTPTAPAAAPAVPEPAAPTAVATPAASTPPATPEPRNEGADIAELCNRCGCPERIGDYLRNETPLDTVRSQLLEIQIANRKLTPSATGGDEPPKPPKATPESKFEAEYEAAAKVYADMGLSKEQYVSSRMVDEGRQQLTMAGV